MKGINAIKYHGSYPVSKLELIDNQLMANMDLYAYSILKPGDLNRSLTPAIIFSLNIQNPNNYPISIDFMYNVPLSTQIDQTRLSKNITQQVASDSYVFNVYHFVIKIVNVLHGIGNWLIISPTCILYSDVGNNVFSSGHC